MIGKPSNSASPPRELHPEAPRWADPHIEGRGGRGAQAGDRALRWPEGLGL